MSIKKTVRRPATLSDADDEAHRILDLLSSPVCYRRLDVPFTDIPFIELDARLRGLSDALDGYLDALRSAWIDEAGADPIGTRCGSIDVQIDPDGTPCLIFVPRVKIRP